MENNTRRAFKSRMDAKQDVWRAIPALMGDGNGTVAVPNQENMVYIRVGDGDLGQAFNNRCQLRDNLAIYVGYDPVTDPDRRIFQVLSVRMADYAGAGNVTVPNVGPHHTTHEFGGGDDVFVDWRRLMGLRVGRPALFVVTVDPGYIYRAGWIAIPSTTVDLTATHAALVGTQAQYVLISLSSVGVVTATAGAVVLSPAALTIADVPTPPAGHIPLAAVRLYKVQTAIGDTPAAPDIIDLRFPTYNTTSAYVTPHDILSTSHGDALAGAVIDGDTIIGNVTPKWSRLAISIPAANVRNALGIDNGELRPSWKTTLDATNPTTIGIGDAGGPGTSLIYSHRDHQHPSPATWTATAHDLLSAIHGDTLASAVSRGSLIYGNATPKWAELDLGGASGSFLTRDANDVLWSGFYLAGSAAHTYTFPDYDISWPAADAHGYLHSDGAGTFTWDAGAGGAPGGADTNVQYNDGGAFGGDANFTWNKTTKALTITGNVITPQLTVGYDGSNYFTATVSSTGTVTFASAGSVGRSFTFANNVIIQTNLVVGSGGGQIATTDDGTLGLSIPTGSVFNLSTTGLTAQLQYQGVLSLTGGGAGSSLTLPAAAIVLAGGGASCTLTLPNAGTTITGGGTLALGTYTLTVPATGTAVLGTGTATRVAAWSDANTLAAGTIVQPAANVLTVTNSAASTLALAITSAKTLTLTATDDFNLTIPKTGTAVVGTGTATRLAVWSDANTLAAGTVVQPATNVLTLLNSAASTLSLAITSAKTLTLTATDDFNLTIPATGTAVIGGGSGANTRVAYWTDANTISSDAGMTYVAATDSLTVAGGLNVGSASSAATGQIKSSAGFMPDSANDLQYRTQKISALAADGVAQIGTALESQGLLMINEIQSYGYPAIFSILGASHFVTEVADPAGKYSITKDTAASINVYWDAVNSRYSVQNKQAGAITLQIWVLTDV